MRLRSILSLVALAAASVGAVACSSSSSTTPSADAGSGDDGGSSGSSGGGDAGGDAAVAATVSFKASNIDLSGIDASKLIDEDTMSDCQVRTDITDCFSKPQYGVVKQSDGSNLAIIVVKSWKLEPTAHVTLSNLSGNIPIAIVSLGDMTLMGSINGSAFNTHPAPGGYDNYVGETNGSGPGGGPKGTTTYGATGASYCGLGGPGSATLNGGGTPAAPVGASGVPELSPLRGGAAGGSGVSSEGGAGGAGLQLVASGAFSLSAAGYISVGGGGGGFGATAGGGGAGGSLLIEAQTISVKGTLAANGGGGGGAGPGLDDGKDGTPDSTPAAGGPGTAAGGIGGAGATIDGQAAPAPSSGTDIAGGGGGGAGRIRLNSKSGMADITSATISPPTTTACVSQGTIK